MKPLQFLMHPDFTNGGRTLKGWKEADDIFKSLWHVAVWNINCSKKSNQSTQKCGQTIECTIGMNKEAHKKTKEAEEKIIARSAKRISKVSWAVIKEPLAIPR